MAETIDKAIQSVQGISSALDMQSKAIPDPYAEGQTANILLKTSNLIGVAGKQIQEKVDDYTELQKGRLEDDLLQEQDSVEKKVALLSARQGEYANMKQDDVYNEINKIQTEFTSKKKSRIEDFNGSALKNLSSGNLYSENLRHKSIQMDNNIQNVVKEAHKQETSINAAKTIHNSAKNLSKHADVIGNLNRDNINTDTAVSTSDILLHLPKTDGDGNPVTNPQQIMEIARNTAVSVVQKTAENGGNSVAVSLSMIGERVKYDKNQKFIGTEIDPEQTKVIDSMLASQGMNEDQIAQYKQGIRDIMNHTLVQSDLESIRDGTYISKYTGRDLREQGNDTSRPYHTIEKVYAGMGMSPTQQTQLIQGAKIGGQKGQGKGEKETAIAINYNVISASIWNDVNKVKEVADQISKETKGLTSSQSIQDEINKRRDVLSNPYSEGYVKAVTELTIEHTGSASPTPTEIYDTCQRFNLPVPPDNATTKNFQSLPLANQIDFINSLSKNDAESIGKLAMISGNKNVMQSEKLQQVYKEMLSSHLKQQSFDKNGKPKKTTDGVYNANLFLKMNGLIDEMPADVIDLKNRDDALQRGEIEKEKNEDPSTKKIQTNFNNNATAYATLEKTTNNKDLAMIQLANSYKDQNSKDLTEKKYDNWFTGGIQNIGSKLTSAIQPPKQKTDLERILPNHITIGAGKTDQTIIIPDYTKTTSGQRAMQNVDKFLPEDQQKNLIRQAVHTDLTEQAKYMKDFILENKKEITIKSGQFSNIESAFDIKNVIIRNSGSSDGLEAVYLNRKTNTYEPVMVGNIPVTFRYQKNSDGTIDTKPTKIGFIDKPTIGVQNYGSYIGGASRKGGGAIGGVDVVDTQLSVENIPERTAKTPKAKVNTQKNPLFNKQK